MRLIQEAKQLAEAELMLDKEKEKNLSVRDEVARIQVQGRRHFFAGSVMEKKYKKSASECGEFKNVRIRSR